MPKTYVIEAFLWGAKNEHNFVVNCFTSEKKALKEAEWYHEHRDRKYGIRIEEYSDNTPYMHKRCIKYFPSKLGETALYDNLMKENLLSLGHMVFDLEEKYINKLPKAIRDEIKRITETDYCNEE
jgi:hypothetical protein